MRSFGGPGAGAGGMPDLAGLMNNPAVMQMAQQMMGNGGLERLMQNPALSNMVCGPSALLAASLIDHRAQMERVQSGGGMPSMAEIMADPQLREMYVYHLSLGDFRISPNFCEQGWFTDGLRAWRCGCRCRWWTSPNMRLMLLTMKHVKCLRPLREARLVMTQVKGYKLT